VRAIFIAALTPFIARLAGTGKVDTRLLLFFGFACIGISQVWLSLITTTQNSFETLIGPAVLGGVGLSLLFTPISIAVLSAVPQSVAPKATAFQSLSLQLGGSFSTAALITLLARREAFHQTILASQATYANVPVQQALQHNPNGLAILYQQIVTQSTALAYADAQFALGVLTLLLMPLIFFLPRRRSGAAMPAAIPAE